LNFTLKQIHSIADIPAKRWDELNTDNNPLLQHCFLSALENSGCVSPETGWTPYHLAWFDSDNEIQAVMPQYLKSHSYGEYMFDWDWARGISQAGIPYYPKIVSAVPFTPVPGQRLMLSNTIDQQMKATLLKQYLNDLKSDEISNQQCLFLTKKEASDWKQAGAMIRHGYQYSWYNHHYQSFDDFLATFRSSSRKSIKRERRILNQAGLKFKHYEDQNITDEVWNFFIQCYQQTYLKRSGHQGYLNQHFFNRLRDSMSDQLLVVCARHNDKAIAASLFIKGNDILYGRYWGTMEMIDGLHFECCYYQGIEYCINAGIRCLQPGTQGDYKRRRGFIPEHVYGAYYFPLAELQQPIQQYLNTEINYIEKQFLDWSKSTPYK